MGKLKSCSGHFKPLLLELLLLTTILHLTNFAIAQTSLPPPNPLLEEWILKQVAFGEEADLKRQFPDEKDRVLSASFLERLLTNSLPNAKVHRHGVQIKGAIVNEPLDLLRAEIPFEIRLIGCRFKNEVDLSRSIFLKGLYFDESIFSSSAKFHSMKVAGTISFNKSIFMGGVDFREVEISSNFFAEGSEFRSTKQEALFNSMKVGSDARFVKAKFFGPVNFESTDIKGNLQANEAQFRSEEKPAIFAYMKVGGRTVFSDAKFLGIAGFLEAVISGDFEADRTEFRSPKGTFFNLMKVGGSVYLLQAIFLGEVRFNGADIAGFFEADGAEFKNTGDFNMMKIGREARVVKVKFFGPVNFGSMDVKGNLQANEAEFRSTNQEASFNSMKVGRHAHFENAKFWGPADFASSVITGSLEASNTEFRNGEAKALFNLMKVESDARFVKAKFFGPVNFESTDIKGNLQANEAEFRSTNQGASFNSMKVGRHAHFENAKFWGPADFGNANISGNFEAEGTKFEKLTTFSGLKVEGRTRFIKTIFGGQVDMTDARFLHISIEGSGEKHQGDFLPYPLDLSRAEIRGELQIRDIALQKIIATSLHVAGPALLENLTIKDELNLEYSNFLNLKLYHVLWPKSKNAIRLRGMTYQYISTGDEGDSWRRLLELARDSVYDANVYTNLENFFRRQGNADRADKVFVEHKRSEREEFLQNIRWFWSLLLDCLVRYGRMPELALLWSLVVIFSGSFTFRRKGMEPKNPTPTLPHYNALWYSFDLFVPIVGLGVASLWTPRKDRWFARNYVHVHKILGVILIPIGLAAITGIIK